jgi:hypothetical protein
MKSACLRHSQCYCRSSSRRFAQKPCDKCLQGTGKTIVIYKTLSKRKSAMFDVLSIGGCVLSRGTSMLEIFDVIGSHW